MPRYSGSKPITRTWKGDGSKINLSQEFAGGEGICEGYPCHHLAEQDCTWCYCPFYPCFSAALGGRYVRSRGRLEWNCRDCIWIHDRGAAESVFEGVRRLLPGIEEVDLTSGKDWEVFARARHRIVSTSLRERDREEADEEFDSDRIISKVSRIPGVRKALCLTEETRMKLLRAEEADERRPDKGFKAVLNIGLREVLDRKEVILIGHDEKLPEPPEPLAVLLAGRTISGEIGSDHGPGTADPRTIRLGKDFLFYPPEAGQRLRGIGPTYFVYPPTLFPGIRKLSGIANATTCTLSHPADACARSLLRLPRSSRLGTILLGFDGSPR